MVAEISYIAGLLFACILALCIAYRAWLNRETAGAPALGATALLAAIWAGGAVGVSLATGDTATLRWHQFSYIGIVWTPAAFAVLALSYTGHERYLTRGVVAGLVAIGGVFLALVWTNPIHNLFWAEITFDSAVLDSISTSPGPGFLLFVVFSYVLLVVGSVLLVRYALTAPDLYRTQTVALLLAVAAPWAANIPSSLQLVSTDLTPVALSVTAVSVWVAMFLYQLTSFAPVALRTVFESISTGLYMVDHQGRIVDLNSAGRELFALDDVVGAPFAEVVPAPVAEQFHTADDHEQEVIELDTPGSATESAPRYYSLQVTPVETKRGRQKGRLVVIDDVTSRQRQRQQLRTQNERLQEFSSVVSHDLRNPLNVASGNLQLAKQEHESSHIDSAQQALDRMETLIGDLLALARQGVESTNPEPTGLASATTTAWETVDTGAATLHNETARTVVADRSQLQQLFENLFRNAVEHSVTPGAGTPPDTAGHGPANHDSRPSQSDADHSSRSGSRTHPDATGDGGWDVTVTVGELDNGFYVADNGPGIPPGEREQVFESGYSTNEEGTGLGLRIVEQVAKAHDWEVALTESVDGGARFEITGVGFVE